MSDATLDRPFLGKLTVEKTIYLAVFACAVFLRFYALGMRPYHHDESIHAFFSWKITQSGLGDYRYDPVYHGPVLYYSSALMMWLFGDTDFTGRLSAVAFGFAVLGLAWPLRRFLGRWGAICFLVLVTFSPAWNYFTRFIRHDIYLAGCNLAAMVFIFVYNQERKAKWLYFAAAALGLGFCTKEDNYFLVPIFLMSVVLSFVWELFYTPKPKEVWRRDLADIGGFFRQAWLPMITGFVIIAIIWSIFYTSFGYHPELWNGISPALKYWIGQHEIKRIGGHWSYYVPQLIFYEPLILFPLAAIVLGALVNRRPASALGKVMYFLAIASMVGFVALLFVGARGSLRAASTAPIVLVLGFGFCLGTVATTWLPDFFTRMAILDALGTVTIYGWAQEKVPWLLVPQLVPLTLVAARWWARSIEDRSLLKPSALIPTALVAVLTIWSTIVSCFIWDAPKPAEPGASLNPPVRHENMLSYVQSTYDIHMVMDRIEGLGKITGTGLKTRLACSGDATWPFSWYLRHYPVNWSANLRNIDQPVVIVDKGVQKSTDEVLLATYEKVPFEIRGWWEPRWDFGTSPNLSDVVRFLITRQVWSPVGSSDAVMYIFKNPQPGQTDLATLTVNPPPAARGYPHAPKALQPVAVFGQKGSGPGEFNEPRSLAVDSAGNLLVMDTKNNRVQKLTPAGQVITTWGSQGDGPGQFKDPHGIAIGPDGSVYVADTWNHRIEKFDPNGKFLMQFGKEEPGFWGPRGIAVSKEGNVYVTDTGNKRIVSFTADGKLLETWGGDGSGQKQFIEPVGIAVNGAGEVVVCDTGNRRLQFFLSDGTFQREQPMYGWEEFYTEPYIAIVGDDVLVTDSYDHRFARYRDGKLAGTWGKSGTGPGEFNRPIGIAAASPTTVYVSDTMNNRIQKFELPAE